MDEAGARPGGKPPPGQACVKCGYDLRGLKVRTRCPECGAPISGGARRSSRFADNLTDSPMWYLVVVASGSVCMAVALVGSFVFAAYERGQSANWNPLPAGLVATGAIGLALAWLLGVGLATVKRPHTENTIRDPILDSAKMRWASRGAQVVFLAGVGVRFAATSTSNATLDFVAGILMYVTLFAIAPLSVYLGSLLDWAGDTGGGDRMRNSAWAFVVAGSGALVADLALRLPVGFKLLLLIMLVLCSIGVLIGVFLFVLSVVGLAYTSAWAVQNASERRVREARIAERKRRQVEAEAARDAAREARSAAMGGGGRPGAGEMVPQPAPMVPIAEREDDRDDVDRALEGLSRGGGGGGGGSPALPGVETGIDPRRSGPIEHAFEPPPTGTEGYDLAPEDDDGRR